MAARARSYTPDARAVWTALLALMVSITAAVAETRLCNRTSVAVEAALAVQAQNTVATRGWFRLDPGQCRVMLQTADTPGRLLIHARAMPVYPAGSLGLAGLDRFCVGERDFLIAGATRCTRGDERLVPFAPMRATVVEGIGVMFLTEEADYDLPQARLAGVQRLLALMGYDAGTVDGIEGPKTAQAIRSFLADRQLPADTMTAPDLFDHLMAAARSGEGPGFAWCNETARTVMAALGVPDGQRIASRGWFRVSPGQCVRPAIEGEPSIVFSFAEAVDDEGRPALAGGRPIVFAGDTALCVRAAEFEFGDQTDCTARGGRTAPFVRIAFDGRRRAVVRFRE